MSVVNKITEYAYGYSSGGILNKRWSEKTIEIFDPTGKRIKHTHKLYGRNGRSTVYKYDKKGNLIKEIDSSYKRKISATKVEEQYDSAGRLVEIIRKSPGGVFHKKIYKYDDLDNVIEYSDEFTNRKYDYDRKFRSFYNFDSKGTFLSYSNINSDGSIEKYIVFNNYDENGNLIEQSFKGIDGMIQSLSRYYYKNNKLRREEMILEYNNEGRWRLDHIYNSLGQITDIIFYDNDLITPYRVCKLIYEFWR